MGRFNRPSKPRKKKELVASITTSGAELKDQIKEIAKEKKLPPAKGGKIRKVKTTTKVVVEADGTRVEQLHAEGKVIAQKIVGKTTPPKPKEQPKVQKVVPVIEEPRYASWSIEGIWNQSIGRPDRPIEPRSHLYASELGKAPHDLFLSLKGVEPSNPPNDRSSRKFEAGDIWEWILELVLRRAGLLVTNQEHIRRCYPGLLEVTGRLDKVAGGKPDWEKARNTITNDFLPDFVKEKAENIVDQMAKKYPNGLKEIVVEVKSTSSFMFDVYDRTKRPGDNHELQAWHYLKNYDEAHVFYINRDDVQVREFPVFANDKRIEATYKGHIETITKYWKADEMPPLEPKIVFDPMLLKFKDNWRIKYSNYLTMLYGYKTQREYEDEFRPMAARFNRVVTRIAEGKDMTKNNKEAIEEMKVYYPDFEKHVDEIKKHKDEILSEPDVISSAEA